MTYLREIAIMLLVVGGVFFVLKSHKDDPVSRRPVNLTDTRRPRAEPPQLVAPTVATLQVEPVHMGPPKQP
jgi:hypothetical protein